MARAGRDILSVGMGREGVGWMAGVINSKPSRILPTAAVRILMRIMYCTVTSYVQNMKSTRNLGLDFSAALRIHIFMLIMHLWSESAL